MRLDMWLICNGICQHSLMQRSSHKYFTSEQLVSRDQGSCDAKKKVNKFQTLIKHAEDVHAHEWPNVVQFRSPPSCAAFAPEPVTDTTARCTQRVSCTRQGYQTCTHTHAAHVSSRALHVRVG